MVGSNDFNIIEIGERMNEKHSSNKCVPMVHHQIETESIVQCEWVKMVSKLTYEQWQLVKLYVYIMCLYVKSYSLLYLPPYNIKCSMFLYDFITNYI